MSQAIPEAAIWHDVECGSYGADLALWRSLAATTSGPILDVGAGTGRVTLDLARRGHQVTALDRDPVLLDVLSARAGGMAVEVAVADARRFALSRRFALCLVPMQTIQLLGGAEGRLEFLRCARAHLRPGATLAAAIAEDLPTFDLSASPFLPPPDLGERDGWTYTSQHDGGLVLERTREAVDPDGRRTRADDSIALDCLSADQLQAEGESAGFSVRETAEIAATAEHVGSRVVMLGA
jgi:SAM-dependent methyltransferase